MRGLIDAVTDERAEFRNRTVKSRSRHAIFSALRVSGDGDRLAERFVLGRVFHHAAEPQVKAVFRGLQIKAPRGRNDAAFGPIK